MKNKRSRRRIKYIVDLAVLKTREFKEMLFFIGIVFLIVGIMIFYVWERIAIYETVYEINHLKSTVSELSKTNKNLELTYYKLVNYNRLEKIAKANLGLVDADSLRVIIVRENGQQEVKPYIKEAAYIDNKRKKGVLSRIIESSVAYAK